MQAVFKLITKDDVLFESWKRQLEGLRLISSDDGEKIFSESIPTVLILDFIAVREIPEDAFGSVIVLVGQEYSERFESMRRNRHVRYSMSYADSMKMLSQIAPVLKELAETKSSNDFLLEKMRTVHAPQLHAPVNKIPAFGPNEIWDFLEGVLESLGSKERLMNEFRRGSRYFLRASHVVFFLRDGSIFRADRGTSTISSEDPVIAYLCRNPVVLDGLSWPGAVDPIAELAVKNRLALWGGRLIVPLHQQGDLLGLIVCGVREDGHYYDEMDRCRALAVARVFRQLLVACELFQKLSSNVERARAAERYLPPSIIILNGEETPRHLPLVVRAVVGQVKRERQNRRIQPSEDQPFRVSAGYIPEIGAVWASWEESSGELYDMVLRGKQERLTVLKEIAQTLNHEIGNALISLTAVAHNTESNSLVPDLLRGAVITDIGRIRVLNKELLELATLTEAVICSVDVRDIVKALGCKWSIKVEVETEPIVLSIAPRLMEFALDGIVCGLIEMRCLPQTAGPMVLQLRATGQGVKTTALLSIRGKGLELEGVLPDSVVGDTPKQGKMNVFIAKEIIRLHQGTIHAGPGLEGTEILISFRQW